MFPYPVINRVIAITQLVGSIVGVLTRLTIQQENRDSLLTHCDTRESVQSAKCTLSSAKIEMLHVQLKCYNATRMLIN